MEMVHLAAPCRWVRLTFTLNSIRTFSHAERDALLAAFRTYYVHRGFRSCRLVHYVGVGKPNAIDVPYAEMEAQVGGCIDEGLVVRWQQERDVLYLAVQEPDCPFPAWEKVFSEEALLDEEALLKQAGFGNAA